MPLQCSGGLFVGPSSVLVVGVICKNNFNLPPEWMAVSA